MTVDIYPWFALVSSLGLLILFGHATWHAARHRHIYHDDRSAYDLLLALTLFIASLGLAASAIASFVSPIGIDVMTRNELRNLGLGTVRGVLVVTGIVMLSIGPRTKVSL